MRLVSTDFAREAIEIFDEDGARQLIESIRDAYQTAEASLPLLAAPDSFRTSFYSQPNPRLTTDQVRGFHQSGTIMESFNRDAELSDLCRAIPVVTLHEMAHLAHFQHQSPAAAWLPNSLFTVAIKEGVAVTAEVENGFVAGSTEIHHRLVAALKQDLVDLIYGDQSVDPRDFYEGKAKPFRFSAYQLGQYIVGSLAEREKLKVAELVQVTFTEYLSFTETHL